MGHEMKDAKIMKEEVQDALARSCEEAIQIGSLNMHAYAGQILGKLHAKTMTKHDEDAARYHAIEATMTKSKRVMQTEFKMEWCQKTND